MEVLTYDSMIDDIKNRRTMAMSRFGDGEWYAILGRQGENCDGLKYTPEMGMALGKILRQPQVYHLGLQDLAVQLIGDEITTWLGDTKPTWFKADIIHLASITGRLGELMTTIWQASDHIIHVGPPHHKSLDFANEFIEVDPHNSWGQVDYILEKVLLSASPVGKRPEYPVIIMCAGMTAKFVIDEVYHYLYAHRRGHGFAIVDMGSALEPYLGHKTRSYHRSMKIKPLTWR